MRPRRRGGLPFAPAPGGPTEVHNLVPPKFPMTLPDPDASPLAGRAPWPAAPVGDARRSGDFRGSSGDGEQAWRAFARVLRSLEAVREGRIWYVLLTTFAVAGLLLAMAQSAFAREQLTLGAVYGGATLFAAFYGGNVAGWLTMLRARNAPPQDLGTVARLVLARAHRLALVVPLLAGVALLLAAMVAGLLWLSRLPWIGPAVYSLVVPVGVLACGLSMLAATAVVLPLAAPAVWAGRSSLQTVRWLARVVQRRLAMAVMLTAVLSLLIGLVGGVVTVVVVGGGRVFALASAYMGIPVPEEALMAGLFGHGLHGLQIGGLAPQLVPHTRAALVGGGVVFAVALVLPGVIYLRGVSEIHLAISESLENEARAGDARLPDGSR